MTYSYVPLQIRSDGAQLHLDDSYTPSTISIRHRDGFHNLKVISMVCVINNNLCLIYIFIYIPSILRPVD
jgi:hypothetical protein